MDPAMPGTCVGYGQPPGAAHGIDVDEQGAGTVTGQRLYHLIRPPKPIADRQFEIEFRCPNGGSQMDELKNHTLGGFPMTKLKSLMTGTTAIMLLLGVPSWAAEQPGLGIANNDSIYIDGGSFKIVPGKGKGDASALIKKLDAHAVGAGMVIFRSGDKLYMADAPSPVIQTGSVTDRYGSDRDTSVSAAQAERDWQEFLRQNRRYGSDRDTSVSAAQAEREWQEYLRQNRRYGSDRDTSVSAAQAERDWREWQEFTRQNPRYGSGRDDYASARYGSDRDTSVSAAQAEREWQEYLRQNRRYGSDREVGPTTAQGERERQDWPQDRRRYYGSDREAGPTTAQGERERQDWPQDRRRYYGSDREAGPTTAQGEREWQEYLRQNRRYGSDRIVIDDPEYADYKLKKIFADNWTASETK
jgi:hypothetical protein